MTPTDPEPPPAKTGRKRKKVDVKVVEELAAIGCTADEIGAVCNIDRSTVFRRFATVIAKGRERLKVSIRRAQYKAVENGNVAMMIWLGKQYLDQRDKFDIDVHKVDELLAEELARVGVVAEQQKLADTIPASDQLQ